MSNYLKNRIMLNWVVLTTFVLACVINILTVPLVITLMSDSYSIFGKIEHGKPHLVLTHKKDNIHYDHNEEKHELFAHYSKDSSNHIIHLPDLDIKTKSVKTLVPDYLYTEPLINLTNYDLYSFIPEKKTNFIEESSLTRNGTISLDLKTVILII